jgi:hypothetical protein
MAAAARILRTSHLLIILLSNLAAANLSIAVPGVANLLFLTPQLQYGLAGGFLGGSRGENTLVSSPTKIIFLPRA